MIGRKRKKTKPEPDTRPKWDDPDLKVMYRGKLYTAEAYQAMCARELNSPGQIYYKNDPTYNWGRKK